MKTRQDFLDKLHNNVAYVAALKTVNKEQAKKISELVEGFVCSFADKLIPIIELAEKDPEHAREIAEELEKDLTDRAELINGVDFVSKSLGD